MALHIPTNTLMGVFKMSDASNTPGKGMMGKAVLSGNLTGKKPLNESLRSLKATNYALEIIQESFYRTLLRRIKSTDAPSYV